MHVFTEAACLRAINLALFGKEGASQQRGFALGTGKAGLCGMPVLPIIGHLRVVHTDMLPARLAVLCIEGLEAAAAEGAAVLHDVPLSPQDRLALQAAEVFHVPMPALSFRALVSKNYLVTC